MTEFLTRTRVDRLDAEQAQLLDAQGFLLLRGAIPAGWIASLREAFEAGVLPSDKWPAPRGREAEQQEDGQRTRALRSVRVDQDEVFDV